VEDFFVIAAEDGAGFLGEGGGDVLWCTHL
jgi:hypothetical protein